MRKLEFMQEQQVSCRVHLQSTHNKIQVLKRLKSCALFNSTELNSINVIWRGAHFSSALYEFVFFYVFLFMFVPFSPIFFVLLFFSVGCHCCFVSHLIFFSVALNKASDKKKRQNIPANLLGTKVLPVITGNKLNRCIENDLLQISVEGRRKMEISINWFA